MHLRATEVVKRPALLGRLTGLSVAEFERLLEPFSREYHQQVIEPRVTAPHRVRGVGGGQKGALPEVGDKLLFILMYTRLYPLLIVQGMFFGMAEPTGCATSKQQVVSKDWNRWLRKEGKWRGKE